MSLHGRNGIKRSGIAVSKALANSGRAAEQSEGGKTVGVDPAVITARRFLPFQLLISANSL